jgi:hypothetical protein
MQWDRDLPEKCVMFSFHMLGANKRKTEISFIVEELARRGTQTYIVTTQFGLASKLVRAGRFGICLGL